MGMAAAGDQMVAKRQSCNNRRNSNLPMKITILVVDDDSISLAIVSAMLRQWSYEVAAVKDPVKALSILRERPGHFDLVVTDLHMPRMDGIQLQKLIFAEFKVPVIIMSSDEKESVILDSLALGAAFFIVKPINPDDLKNVWQHAVAAKKGKSLLIEEFGSHLAEPWRNDMTTSFKDKPFSSNSSSQKSPDDGQSESSLEVDHGYKNQRKDCKRKTRKSGNKDDENDDDDDDDDRAHPPAPKKAKVVWTNSLHNRFLQAIRHIGLDKAVPKKILEFMNVPGLTRENVASHLQKYRMFLKRVAEKTVSATEGLTEKTLRSSFASGHELSLVELAQQYSRLAQRQQMMREGAFQAGLGGAVSALSTTTIGCMHLPSQAAPSNSSMPRLGFGQSNSLGNQYGNQSIFGNTNGWSSYGGGTSTCATSLSANNGLINHGATAGTGLLNIGSSYTYNSTNQGASNCFTSPNQVTNNYAGIRINSKRELLGMAQISHNDDGFGFMNGTGNPAIGNQTSGFDSGGFGDYEFDLMNGDAFVLDNITNSQQQMGGNGLADMFLDQTKYQEGGDCDQLVNQFLNSDFSTICCIEQGLGQSEKEGEFTNGEPNSMNPMNNEASSSGNQPIYSDQSCWEDDFLDSLFGFDAS